MQEGVFVHVAQVVFLLRIFSDGFGPLRFCLVGSGFDQREGCRCGFFVELSDEAEGISLIEIGIMAVSLGQCVDNRLNVFGCSVDDVFDELILQSLRQEQTTQNRSMLLRHCGWPVRTVGYIHVLLLLLLQEAWPS